jgi:hypothetical protein
MTKITIWRGIGPEKKGGVGSFYELAVQSIGVSGGIVHTNGPPLTTVQCPKFRTPGLIMEIQGLKNITRKLILTLATRMS